MKPERIKNKFIKIKFDIFLKIIVIEKIIIPQNNPKI